MKAILTLILNLIIFQTIAQAPPQAFNYSGVARNPAGQPIANSPVGIQISILQGSATGNVQYSENHVVTTDAFGLFNLAIGGGSIVTGNFGAINWSNNSYFLQIGMDVNGGTNFTQMGTTQFLSVPYALHATSAQNISNGANTISFSAPTITNVSTTNIQGASATLNATINANGLLTDNILFEYGTTTAYGNSVLASPMYVTGNSPVQVQAQINNLPGNATIHYRVSAKNAVNVSQSNNQNFTTNSSLPIIISVSKDSISPSTHRFVAMVNANGSNTNVSFEYGFSPNLGTTVNAIPNSISGNNPTQVLTNPITLNTSTMVYFRCKATNAQGTVYSNIFSVTWL